MSFRFQAQTTGESGIFTELEKTEGRSDWREKSQRVEFWTCVFTFQQIVNLIPQAQ
jgi:hypothetical protein